PFRVRPPDDDELLAAQGFGFAPQASVSRRVRRIDVLRDHALKTELAGVLQDEFAVACVVAIELKAGLVRDQRLKERLTLDERKLRGVPIGQVQEIESVKDEPHFALAVGRGLSLSKTRQSG